MQEAEIVLNRALMADQDATKVDQPGEQMRDFLIAPLARQRMTILYLRLFAVLAVRAL